MCEGTTSGEEVIGLQQAESRSHVGEVLDIVERAVLDALEDEPD